MTPVDPTKIRRLAKAAWINPDGWVRGPAYSLTNGARVHCVLTEPDGAELAEHCLPNHATFIAAASAMLPRAAAEIDALRSGLHRLLWLSVADDAECTCSSGDICPQCEAMRALGFAKWRGAKYATKVLATKRSTRHG